MEGVSTEQGKEIDNEMIKAMQTEWTDDCYDVYRGEKGELIWDLLKESLTFIFC